MATEAVMSRAVQKDNLVGNAQNPLDHLVGDVMGETRLGKYFIIEFKRDLKGFAQEVNLGSTGKIDRAALMDHLDIDEKCKGLADKGHFGAYGQVGAIVLGRYREFALALPNQQLQAIPSFFDSMHRDDFAWNAGELEDYVNCMRSHGDSFQTDDGRVVFGYYDRKGKVVLMVSSLRIIAMIHDAFLAARASLAKQTLGTTGKRPGKNGKRR